MSLWHVINFASWTMKFVHILANSVIYGENISLVESSRVLNIFISTHILAFLYHRRTNIFQRQTHFLKKQLMHQNPCNSYRNHFPNVKYFISLLGYINTSVGRRKGYFLSAGSIFLGFFIMAVSSVGSRQLTRHKSSRSSMKT